jgi:ubiquinone/menaquinone biosynthesis C-methylase UbiE
MRAVHDQPSIKLQNSFEPRGRSTIFNNFLQIATITAIKLTECDAPRETKAMDATSVTWDYSALARPYLKRPDYSEAGLDAVLAITKVKNRSPVCDVGAGIGHLTLPLAQRHLTVTAVEPNDEMRKLGIERTRNITNISWQKGTGEATGLSSNAFTLVTFGSSFNVTNREMALHETNRILCKGGWFSCMWNHRDLSDPLQRDVEALIREYIPDYDYGSRREDQTPIIEKSGLFFAPYQIEAPVIHRIPVSDWIEAWRSHATLERQSRGKLHEIVDSIESLLISRGYSEITVPYKSRIWLAQSRK